MHQTPQARSTQPPSSPAGDLLTDVSIVVAVFIMAATLVGMVML